MCIHHVSFILLISPQSSLVQNLMSHCDFAAGWIGGTVAFLVGHPLDTVKVYQQTKGIGIRRCVQELYRQRGCKGFFRGISFPLIANGTMSSAFFGVYGTTLDYLNCLEIRRNSHANVKVPQQYSALNIFMAGSLAACPLLLISCPVEVIKIKLQTHVDISHSSRYQSPILLSTYILKTHGLKGMYQGIITMAWRDVPALGYYMVVYEKCSKWVKSWNIDKSGMSSTCGLFVSGGIAGVASWSTFLPLDTIKSRIQSQDPTQPNSNKSALNCAKEIFKKEGIKGFFRGFSSITLRAFLVNGSRLLIYEMCKSICSDLRLLN